MGLAIMPAGANTADVSDEQTDTVQTIVMYNNDCEMMDNKSANIFFVSMGFDINTRIRDRVKFLDNDFDISTHYKYDAPTISAGFDIDGTSAGVHLAWRRDGDLRLRSATVQLEIPLAPFSIMPYVILESGLADMEYQMGDVEFYDWAFIYGTGFGVRMNIGNQAFIKLYQTCSWTRFRDDLFDIDINMRARYRRIGIAIGYTF